MVGQGVCVRALEIVRADSQHELADGDDGTDGDRAKALIAWAEQVHPDDVDGRGLLLTALPYLLRIAPNDDGACLIASWRGLATSKASSLSAEDALMGLLEAIGEHLSPSLARSLLATAYRRALDRARNDSR